LIFPSFFILIHPSPFSFILLQNKPQLIYPLPKYILSLHHYSAFFQNMDTLTAGQRSNLNVITAAAQICLHSIEACASVSDNGPLPLLAFIQKFLDGISPFVSLATPVDVYGNLIPLLAFQSTSDNRMSYNPPRSTRLNLSPLECAALQGSDKILRLLLDLSKRDQMLQDDLDFSLFLALCFRHRKTADLLPDNGADPKRDGLSNGLHGAAYGGLVDEISLYVIEYGAEVDVEDGNGVTAVMYAMGLEYPQSWEVVEHLFRLGADPSFRVGQGDWTYAQYARDMGKIHLAERLEEAEMYSPTQYALSRESSCTLDEYE
jgi:hypothetical protein